jgi:hypothetical protein
LATSVFNSFLEYDPMTPYLRFSILVLALMAGPAAAETAAETTVLADAAGDCPLTGPVADTSDGCSAQRVQYREAMAACLQDRRVKALAANRLGAGHSISAPAARAQMLICQAQIGGPAVVVE